ncbi:hypothetical protein BJ742DRAFT_366125 [Cladochytrium replicatum]|nr:hypothetical protein BJ742DRAFT_366125 [Cladochytrium replicatum]
MSTINLKFELNQHMLPDNVPKKPMYFRFLAMVAFHCFLKEKVDVGVIEVGIGGEYDCTNVVEQPDVCGITGRTSTIGCPWCQYLGTAR